MDKDPSVIRAEIEQTRERVGDEVDAISYKTDVGARASDYVDDKKEAVKRGATHMRETAANNPLGLAAGGLALGFLVGTLLPKTHVENEQMGEMSDRLMDTAKETASEAVGRGKQVAQEAVDAAVDTAKE